MDDISIELAGLHFLRPIWLLGLAGLLGLPWWWHRQSTAASPWQRVVDRHLLDALGETGGRAARSPRRLLWLLLMLCLLALAGPAYRTLPQPMVGNESALVVVVDQSDRMRATDLKPSRADRIRYKLTDLLRLRRDGQTALVVFAGEAFTVAPLTDDAAALSALVLALSPELLPVPGQRLEGGLAEAEKLLAGVAGERRVLVISDRADLAGVAAAKRLAALGVRIDVLGVGTAAGAPIPQPGSGFARDAKGEVEMAVLDGTSLTDFAAASGGRYRELASDDSDLNDLLGGVEARADQSMATTEAAPTRWRDEGPWLLLLALPLAALLFRRGWVFAVVLSVTLPRPAAAFDLESLWQRDDQRAWSALQSGQHEQARALAPNTELRGAAAYRAGDFGGASSEYQQGEGADARYNQGNALARDGKLEEALAAYDRALQQAPDLEDAKFNRDLVEQALREQQARQQDQKQQSGKDGESAKDQPGQPKQGEDEAEQTAAQQEQEGKGGEKSPDPTQSEQRDPRQTAAAQSAEGGSGEGTQDDARDLADAEANSAAQDQKKAEANKEFAQAMETAIKDGEAPGKDASQLEKPTIAQPIDDASAEKQQAAEAWLRRIPDDPGGLLRRKFALESRQRQLEQGERP